MSSFYFDHEYTTSDASQLMTYTVLGESTSDMFEEDQVIEVHVTPTELGSILGVASGWADDSLAKVQDGEQIYPTLEFGLEAGPLGKMQTKDTLFRVADDTEVAPMFEDDSTSDKKKLQNFMNEDDEFTYAAGQPTWLLKIPSLSITKVERTDYTADGVAAIFPGSKGVTVDAASANNTLASEPLAVRNLFEQLVAANKITQAGAVSMAAGDQLDLNVNYELARIYSFKIDATLSASAGRSSAAAAQFNIDGADQSLPTGDPTNVTGSRTVKITWRLVATAPPPPI